MERAVRILSAMYATASGLVAAAVIMLVVAFLRQQPPGHPAEPRHLVELSMLSTAGVVFAIIYAVLAWMIVRRVKWRLALILSAAALFLFPVGTVLAIASFVLLTRPEIRKTFAS